MTDMIDTEMSSINGNSKSSKQLNILISAARVFSKKNFYQVKVQEIADVAKVGKGTIYEYFSSKEELFYEMIKEGFRQYRRQAQLVPQENREIWDKLTCFLERHASFVWENQQIASLLLSNSHPFQEKLANWMLEMREVLLENIENTFQVAVEREEIEEINTNVTARMFWGTVTEVITAMVIFEGKKPDRAVIEEVVSTFKTGVEKRESSRH